MTDNKHHPPLQWHEPGVGGVVYNPPDIVHAMRAEAKPLFAIWCLPLDNTPHS